MYLCLSKRHRMGQKQSLHTLFPGRTGAGQSLSLAVTSDVAVQIWFVDYHASHLSENSMKYFT